MTGGQRYKALTENMFSGLHYFLYVCSITYYNNTPKVS